jgi:hypothetical protein
LFATASNSSLGIEDEFGNNDGLSPGNINSQGKEVAKLRFTHDAHCCNPKERNWADQKRETDLSAAIGYLVFEVKDQVPSPKGCRAYRELLTIWLVRYLGASVCRGILTPISLREYPQDCSVVSDHPQILQQPDSTFPFVNVKSPSQR